MTSPLIRNARHIITMDDARTEIAGGHVAIRDGWIESVGAEEPPGEFDDVRRVIEDDAALWVTS